MTNDNGIFADDIKQHGSYAYTTQILSGHMANDRISKSILGIDSFAGKQVLDIGCGDGTYSYELATQTKAALVVAIDPVEAAIAHAHEKYNNINNLRFECVDLYKMDLPSPPLYDIAVLRGVLHHLPDLAKGIGIACQLAKKIIIIEPNGHNPVLKIIEKTSKYHLDHKGQSFKPALLRKLFYRKWRKNHCRGIYRAGAILFA